MFAEDIGILPDRLFTKLVEKSLREQANFDRYASELFKAMCTGGSFGLDQIAWFNGGLFDDGTALPLDARQLRTVAEVAKNDWSAIDPSIFGTLFERGLDPAKRSQLGAHYTDPENIMRIVEPVVLRPLRKEWEETKAKIEQAKQLAKRKALLAAYLERLRAVKVLDPACGSGNFLYLALKSLKDFELFVLLEAEALGLERAFPELDVACVKGIELSPFAAELARVTVWIGELQWQIEHGFDVQRNPILRALETIENRDALLETVESHDGETAESLTLPATWPAADFIIGNPPFIGDKRMREELGDEYTETLRRIYRAVVPGGADFVCYWFAKLLAQNELGVKRVGLVSTQMIRRGRNNEVIRSLTASGFRLFDVWQNEPWHDNGALVRTSIVCLLAPNERPDTLRIDSKPTDRINVDLSGGLDLSGVQPLAANAGLSINGVSRAGRFNVPEATALDWLLLPNPNGRPNSDVLSPTWGADDLGGYWSGEWLIDFGCDMAEQDAALYAAPFEWIEEYVKPVRAVNNRPTRRDKWWIHGEPRRGMRQMLVGKTRQLVTGESMVQRFFRWLSVEVLPDHKLVVFGMDDDYSLGVLESRVHRVWAKALSSQQGVVNNDVYPASRTFGTFPFPPDAQRQAISDAACELNELRENYLNPPEWTTEETLNFPATVGGPWHRWIPNGDSLTNGSVAEAHYVRRVARPGARAMVAARTLTKLYNERPAWLRHAHEKLDIAVATAYGNDPQIPEPDLLAFLLNLNLARSASHP